MTNNSHTTTMNFLKYNSVVNCTESFSQINKYTQMLNFILQRVVNRFHEPIDRLAVDEFFCENQIEN